MGSAHIIWTGENIKLTFGFFLKIPDEGQKGWSRGKPNSFRDTEQKEEIAMVNLGRLLI